MASHFLRALHRPKRAPLQVLSLSEAFVPLQPKKVLILRFLRSQRLSDRGFCRMPR